MLAVEQFYDLLGSVYYAVRSQSLMVLLVGRVSPLVVELTRALGELEESKTSKAPAALDA